MNIYTLTTLNDWVAAYGTWGEVGLEKIFDVLKVARIPRVYWRVFDGGLANYPSKVAQRFDGSKFTDEITKGEHGGPHSFHSYKPVRNDNWDALATAVRVGRSRGIEVCAWFTVYEEDHGGAFGSRLARRDDLCQQDRAGRVYPGAVELFFPEVQHYKLQITRELLARRVDGLLLDFARHNATPSADTTGVHRFGYNPEVCRAFQRQDGRDPHDIPADDPAWLAFKNRYQTDFVRRIRRLVGSQRRLDLLVWNVDNYRWLGLDVPSLTREKQVDLLASFNITYATSPKAMRAQYRSLKSQTRGPHTKIAIGLQSYFGIDPDDFEQALHAAAGAGADALLLHESDHLLGDRLLTAVRAFHLGAPRKSRAVMVRCLARAPTARDWQRARKYAQPLFILAGPDRATTPARAEFRFLADRAALHCRLVCHGKQAAPRPLTAQTVYVAALGARLYFRQADRGHLLLDPGRTRRRFLHFILGRAGDRLQETNVENLWRAPWQGRATRVNATQWIAEWTLPYSTLGTAPRPGDRWGFQIIREHAARREVSGWFVTATPPSNGLRPHEWGDLVFI
jgi:hypothetical protein